MRTKSLDVADAINLRSAFCLLSAARKYHSFALSKHVAGQENSNPVLFSKRVVSLLERLSPTIGSTESFDDIYVGHVREFDLPTVEGFLSAALESFKLSLQLNGKHRAQTSAIDIAGHRIQEAQSWDDFERLAQLNIATLGGEHIAHAQLNGSLVHGLLVVGRILPKHTFYVDFVEEVFSILSCEQHLVSIKHARSTEQRHQAWPATQGDTRLEFSPSEVPQYSLLVHHLELWVACLQRNSPTWE